jgi:hypothetical protein
MPQFFVSVAPGPGDLTISLKKKENTYVTSGIQIHSLSFHVVEDSQLRK